MERHRRERRRRTIRGEERILNLREGAVELGTMIMDSSWGLTIRMKGKIAASIVQGSLLVAGLRFTEYWLEFWENSSNG